MDVIEWGRAVCYSGYRENQSPKDKTYPSKKEILEDLNIIVKEGFKYIRMYDACEYTERVCDVIRENKLPLLVMQGPGLINEVNNAGCEWNKTIYSEEELAERRKQNEKAIDRLVSMANRYSDIIFCVSVGNENTPSWGENTVPVERLCLYADRLKKETGKPVTFNEGAREWRKAEIAPLVEHMDLICIHSYPLWYGLRVDEALKANKEDYEAVKALYPGKQVIFSEAGWTTKTLPNHGMVNDQPNEKNQAEYYSQFWEWTDREKITAFVFEMFDEPWKGSGNPDESEKHWGIYNVDRSPKLYWKK